MNTNDFLRQERALENSLGQTDPFDYIDFQRRTPLGIAAFRGVDSGFAPSGLSVDLQNAIDQAFTGEEILEYTPGMYQTYAAREMFRKTYDNRFAELTGQLDDKDGVGILEAFWEGNTSVMEDTMLQFTEHGLGELDFDTPEERQAYVDAMQSAMSAYKGVIASGGTGTQAALTFGETLNEVGVSAAAGAGVGALLTAWTGPGALIGAKIGGIVGGLAGMTRLAFRLWDATEREYEGELIAENIKRIQEGRELMKYDRDEVVQRATAAVAVEAAVELGVGTLTGFQGNAAIRAIRKTGGEVAEELVEGVVKAAVRDTKSTTANVLRAGGRNLTREIVPGAVNEGLEEGLANIGNTIAAELLSDIEADRFDLSEVGHDALLGAIVGGGMQVSQNVHAAPIRSALRKKARAEVGRKARKGLAAAKRTAEMEENLGPEIDAFTQLDNDGQEAELQGWKNERQKVAEQADETRIAQLENAAQLKEAVADGEDTSALEKEAERLEEQEATLEDELMRLDTGINARQNILGVQVSGRQAGERTVDDFLKQEKAEQVTELTEDQQAAVTFGNELGVEVVVLKGDGDSMFARSVSQNGNAVVFVHEGSITTKFDGMSEVIHEVSHATAHSDTALYAEIRGTLDELAILSAGAEYVAGAGDSSPTQMRAHKAALRVVGAEEGGPLTDSLEDQEAAAVLEAEGVARAIEKGVRENRGRIDSLLIRAGLGSREATAARKVIGLLKNAAKEGKKLQPKDRIGGVGAVSTRMSETALGRERAQAERLEAQLPRIRAALERKAAAEARIAGAEAEAAPEAAPEAPAPEAELPGAEDEIDIDISRNALRATVETDRLAITQTPEFRAFFGNSKVVDEDGQPKVVYHGTTHFFGLGRQAKVFDPRRGDGGVHLTSEPRVANLFATRSLSMRMEQAELLGQEFSGELDPDSRIYPLYVRMENPLVMVDEGSWNNVRFMPENIARAMGRPNNGNLLYELAADFIRDNAGQRVEEIRQEIADLEQLGDTHGVKMAQRKLNSLQKNLNGITANTVKVHGFPELEVAFSNRLLRHLLKAVGHDGIQYVNRFEVAPSPQHLMEISGGHTSMMIDIIGREAKKKFGLTAEPNQHPMDGGLTDGQMVELFEEMGIEPDICYLCIDANQMKSATGNDGGFRLHDDDISRNRAAKPKDKAAKKAAKEAEAKAAGHIIVGVDKAVSSVTLLDLERVIPLDDKTGGEPINLRNGQPHVMVDGRKFVEMDPTMTTTLPEITQEEIQEAHESAVIAIGGEAEFEALKQRNATKVANDKTLVITVGNKRDGIDPSTRGVFGTEEFDRLVEQNPPNPELEEPTAVKATLQHAEDGTPALLDAAFVNESLALPAAQRFWYETFGEDVGGFLPDLRGSGSSALLFANLISATSAQTKVPENTRRGLGIFASTEVGEASMVGMQDPTSVQSAQTLDEYGLDGEYKTGSFAPTLLLGLGVYNDQRGVPLTVLDAIMSRFFRLPQSVMADPVMYRYAHTVLARIAQTVNAKRRESPEFRAAQQRMADGTATDFDIMLLEPIRPWHVQATMWSNRADDSGTFSEELNIIREQLIAAGIQPGKDGGFTAEQLSTPEAQAVILPSTPVRQGVVSHLQVGPAVGPMNRAKDAALATAYALINSDLLTDAQRQTLRNKLGAVVQQDINLLKDMTGARPRLVPAKHARVGLESKSFEAFVDASTVEGAAGDATARIEEDGGKASDIKPTKQTMTMRLPTYAMGLGINETLALVQAEARDGKYRTTSLGLMSQSKVLGEGSYIVGSAGVRDGFTTPEEHILLPGTTAAEATSAMLLLGTSLGMSKVQSHRLVSPDHPNAHPAMTVFVPGDVVKQENATKIARAMAPHGMQIVVRSVTNGSLIIATGFNKNPITDSATQSFAAAINDNVSGELSVSESALDYAEQETGLRGDGTDSPADIRAAEDKIVSQAAREDAGPNSEWRTGLNGQQQKAFESAGITTQQQFAALVAPSRDNPASREAFERVAELPIADRKRVAESLGRSRAYQLHVIRNQARELTAEHTLKVAKPLDALEKLLATPENVAKANEVEAQIDNDIDVSRNRTAPKSRGEVQSRAKANLDKLGSHRAGPMFAMILNDVQQTQSSMLGARLGTSPGLAATDAILGTLEVVEQLAEADAKARSDAHAEELRAAIRDTKERVRAAERSRAELRIVAQKRAEEERRIKLRQSKIDALKKAAEDKREQVQRQKDRIAKLKEQAAEAKAEYKARLEQQREDAEIALKELDADRLARTQRLLDQAEERAANELNKLQSKYEARNQIEQARREAVNRLKSSLLLLVETRLPKSERGAFVRALSKDNITLDRFEKIAARVHVAAATNDLRKVKGKTQNRAKKYKRGNMSTSTRNDIQEKLIEAAGLLDANKAKKEAATRFGPGFDKLSDQQKKAEYAMEIRRRADRAEALLGEAEALYQADREAYMDTKNERGAEIRNRVDRVLTKLAGLPDRDQVGGISGDPVQTGFGDIGMRGGLDLKAALDEIGLNGEHSNLAAAESAMLGSRRDILSALDEAAREAGYDSLTELTAQTSGSKGLSERNTVRFTFRKADGTTDSAVISLGQAMKLLAFDDETLGEMQKQSKNGKQMRLDVAVAERTGKKEIAGPDLVSDVLAFREMAKSDPKLAPLLKFVNRAKQLREEQVRPRAMAALYRLTGNVPPLVPGYEPRKVRREVAVNPDTLLSENSSQAVARMATSASLTKERTGGATIRVTDFMMDYYESVDDGLRLGHMGEPMRVLWSAITDSEVETALESKMGTDGYKNLRTQVGYALGIVSPTAGEDILGDVISVGASAAISFNFQTWIKVLGGGINNLQLAMSSGEVFKGFLQAAQLLASGRLPEWYETNVLAKNGYFWDRDHSSPIDRRVTFTRDDGIANVKDIVNFQEVMSRTGTKLFQSLQALAVGNVKDTKRLAREALTALRGIGRAIPVLRMLDQFIVTAAVLGKADINNVTPEALHEAELAVRNSQNTSSPLDDAQVAATRRVAGGMTAKLLTFSSDPLKTMSRMAEAQPGSQRAKQIGVAVAGNAAISIVAKHLYLMLMLGLLDDDDEADEMIAELEKAKVADSYDKVVIEEVIGRAGPLGFLFSRPLGGLYNELENMTTVGARPSQYTTRAFVEAFVPIGLAPVVELPISMIGAATTGDEDKRGEKLEDAFIDFLQVILGLPVGPVSPLIDAGFTETNAAEIRSAEYGLRQRVQKDVLDRHKAVRSKANRRAKELREQREAAR